MDNELHALENNKRDYTLKEIATKTGYSYTTIYKLAAQGKLPGAYQWKPGKQWFVDRVIFDAYFAKIKNL